MDGQASKEKVVVKRLTSKRTPVNSKEPIHVCSNASLDVTFEIRLPAGCYLTEGVTSNWQFMVFRPQEGKWGCFTHWSLGWQCVLLTNLFCFQRCVRRFWLEFNTFTLLKTSLTVLANWLHPPLKFRETKMSYVNMSAIPLDFKVAVVILPWILGKMS